MGQFIHEALLESRFQRRGKWLEENLRRYPEDLRIREDGELTILYEGEECLVAKIRTMSVGGEEVILYYLSDGTRFERWIRQNELVPPWKRNWYQLPDGARVYLRGNQLKELVEDAVKRAGGQRALARRIGDIGGLLHGDWEGMTVRKLKALLNFLDSDYNSVEKSVEALGGGKAVRNPMLPFNLNSNPGARLIARALSDGSLYLRHRNTHIFEYYSKDKEAIYVAIDDVNKVYGDVDAEPSLREDIGLYRVVFSTSIAEPLVRAGGPLGRKVVENPSLSIWVRYNAREIQKAYLGQVFDDEGNVDPSGYVRYKRGVDITDALRPGQAEFLEKMEWKDRRTPTGGIIRYVSLTRNVKSQLEDVGIWHTICSHPPRLMIDEVELLGSRFGISFNVYPKELHKTRRGYGIVWVARTLSRDDTRRFEEEINFGLRRKRDKLEEVLR